MRMDIYATAYGGFMHLGITAETLPLEKRVATTPDVVKAYQKGLHDLCGNRGRGKITYLG